MRIRQFVYFAIISERVTAAEIATRLALEPDQAVVQGSRSAEPMRPATHRWKIVSDGPGLRVDQQIQALVERLEPHSDRIRELIDESQGADPGHSRAVLQIVRYFDDDEGEEDRPTPAGSGFTKLEGQHHLLGFGIDAPTLRFLQKTSATISVDEYG